MSGFTLPFSPLRPVSCISLFWLFSDYLLVSNLHCQLTQVCCQVRSCPHVGPIPLPIFFVSVGILSSPWRTSFTVPEALLRGSLSDPVQLNCSYFPIVFERYLVAQNSQEISLPLPFILLNILFYSLSNLHHLWWEIRVSVHSVFSSPPPLTGFKILSLF